MHDACKPDPLSDSHSKRKFGTIWLSTQSMVGISVYSEPIGEKTALSPYVESDDSLLDSARGITSCPCLQSVAHPNRLILSPRGPLELLGR